MPFNLGSKVVEQEIDKRSDLGMSMQDVLFRGEALSTDFMIQLLKYVITLFEVAGLVTFGGKKHKNRQRIFVLGL